MQCNQRKRTSILKLATANSSDAARSIDWSLAPKLFARGNWSSVTFVWVRKLLISRLVVTVYDFWVNVIRVKLHFHHALEHGTRAACGTFGTSSDWNCGKPGILENFCVTIVRIVNVAPIHCSSASPGLRKQTRKDKYF